MQATYGLAIDWYLQSAVELSELLTDIPAKGRPDKVVVRDLDGLSAELASMSYTSGASYWLGSMVFADSVRDHCRAAGLAEPKGHPDDAVQDWAAAHSCTRASGTAKT